MCSMRDCEKYAQHLIRNFKNIGTSSALLPERHMRLKLEFIVFFVGKFVFNHWTAVIYAVRSTQRVEETFSL